MFDFKVLLMKYLSYFYSNININRAKAQNIVSILSNALQTSEFYFRYLDNFSIFFSCFFSSFITLPEIPHKGEVRPFHDEKVSVELRAVIPFLTGR